MKKYVITYESHSQTSTKTILANNCSLEDGVLIFYEGQRVVACIKNWKDVVVDGYEE